MSLETTTNRAVYNGDGSQTVFPYNFLIVENSDLVVTRTESVTGLDTLLSLNVHYTVSGAGSGSGNVTLSTAPSSGTRITIQRRVARTQERDYVENDAFPAETHEQALDKLTMIVQEHDQALERTLRQPSGDEVDIAPIPSKVERASTYAGYDADGNPIALAPPTDTTLVSSFAATLLDDGNIADALATLGLTYGEFEPDLTFTTAGDFACTYAYRRGYYVKFGKLVWVSFFLITSTFTYTTASGALVVTGLPLQASAAYDEATLPAVVIGDVDAAHLGHFLTVSTLGTGTLHATTAGSYTQVNTDDLPTASTVYVRATGLYVVD